MASDVIEGVPARHWHRLEDGRIQCDVCPRYCRLHDGQRGLCFVRARRGEELVLTTYGRSSGFCIDPIEKKPLNHFLPGTPVLSFGTAGCNLTCKFCQNWDISKAREFDRLQDQASPEAIARAAERSGCRSVAYTYNDPVIFLEYAIDVAKACRARSIQNVAVSAGYMCAAPRAEFYRHMDAANIDLKAFTEGFYKKLCTGALQPVLETVEYIRNETDVWLEITTLLIPGHNDEPAEIEALSAWVMDHLGPDVPLHFTAFHPDYKMLDVAHTPPATLTRARDIALRHGLRYVYTGNVHDEAGQSTYCHACGERVIGRDWYEITAWHLTADGCCERCGAECAGVFEARPGAWGQRRMPIWLGGAAAAI
jgi:pyruvate formate lyase activating enzyme